MMQARQSLVGSPNRLESESSRNKSLALIARQRPTSEMQVQRYERRREMNMLFIKCFKFAQSKLARR